MINPPPVLPEEPTAVTPHGGFCGGKSQQWLRYPTNPLVRICAGGVRRRASLPRAAHPAFGAAGVKPPGGVDTRPFAGTPPDGEVASFSSRSTLCCRPSA